MKVTAKGGGGFSGGVEQFSCDTAHSGNGAALEAMLGQLNFFAAAPAAALGADIPRWEITVDDGRRCHTVCFSEDGSAASAAWQALLAQIRQST